MTTAPPLPLADTSDMIGLHRVFRDALAAAPSLVGSAADGEVDRAAFVAGYYQTVLLLLHAHHEGEDELLTPRLRERGTAEEAEAVGRIAAQHEPVLAELTRAEAALRAWATDGSASSRDAAGAALGSLGGALVPHLDEEERVVLPIAARYVNVAEWGELPEHGLRSYQGDKMWLLLGLVQEQMTPQQRAVMEAHMPPPLVEFWNGPGRDLFADYVTRLRG